MHEGKKQEIEGGEKEGEKEGKREEVFLEQCQASDKAFRKVKCFPFPKSYN